MANVADYISLITSEHQLPKMEAELTVAVAPAVSLQNLLSNMAAAFDIDNAVGVQLDAVGEWIGRSRNIGVPITGVYFEFDGDASVGWDSGVWQGPFDPNSGLVNLPDDVYRTLLRTKIVANRWSGSIPEAYDIWTSVFPNSAIAIQDNQNMTMTVSILGIYLDAVSLALLVQGYIPLKPQGVRIDSFNILPEAGMMFAWDNEIYQSAYDDAFDLDTPPQYFGGWDQGQWPEVIQST